MNDKTESLTRRALYELVWTQPRTELAKQFKISDVALGKLCRQMNVPAPPQGYWAHVASKSQGKAKFARPPLSYTVYERIDEDHAEIRNSLPQFDPKNLSEPLPPLPAPSESQDDAVKRYVGLVRAVPLPKPGRGTHPVVEKLLKEDERLATIATNFSWDKPKYKDATGRKLLTGLNRLLWWWTDLGFKPGSSGTRHIHLNVTLGGYLESFEVTAGPVDTLRPSSPNTSNHQFSLRLDTRYTSQARKPDLCFSNFDTEDLVATATLLIQRREAEFRAGLKREHAHKVWVREDALKKDLEAKEAMRQRREAAHKELISSREQAIDGAIFGMRKSDELRALVKALEQKSAGLKDGGIAFSRWKKWLLAKADALDLRLMSTDDLDVWIAGFRLSDDDPVV